MKESASSSLRSRRKFFKEMTGLKKVVLNGTDTMQYTNYLAVHNIFI